MDNLLIEIAKERFENPKNHSVHLVDDEIANSFLNDLKRYPHAFVLACLMDRQMKAERAWMIPYEISKEIGTFDFDNLTNLSLRKIKSIFKRKSLHRYPDTMAECFYLGIKDIKIKYNGNAAEIWTGKPSSSAVVYKFLEFKGCGVKIATMAANILARQFRIPFSDLYSIDISPDVHIKRVLKRMGYVPKDASNEMIIYKARELYPKFPGIIDHTCWEIGRNWCKPRKPTCSECIVEATCKKVI